LIYEIVIAALTTFFWLPSFFLPWMSFYRQHYLPLNFIFSYLWLTAFVFAALDYNRHNCLANSPLFGSCALKYANEAFIFLAFFFTLVAMVVDAMAWRNTGRPANHYEKDVRHSAETGATATNV